MSRPDPWMYFYRLISCSTEILVIFTASVLVDPESCELDWRGSGLCSFSCARPQQPSTDNYYWLLWLGRGSSDLFRFLFENQIIV